MNEILSVLYQKNPKMRIVINAISLETICEIKEVLSDYPIENEELIQLQVSRARVAGSYHLMQAENQVWICAFDFLWIKGRIYDMKLDRVMIAAPKKRKRQDNDYLCDITDPKRYGKTSGLL